MKRQVSLKHEFVAYIPDKLEDGTIYVSVTYATAVHKCCCGCGREVVTPLSPADWTLIFDGRSISLEPSIGNWSFPCQSHYWIRQNTVQWATQWSQSQIKAGRARDVLAKQAHFKDNKAPVDAGAAGAGTPKEGFWRKLWKRIR